MPTVAKYRIHSPTIALFFEDGRHVARTVPTGAIVTAELIEGVDPAKLVEATWNGQKVLMFTQDLRSRGERMDYA